MLHQEPYWTGYKCGETNPFLLFWFYLIYVIFVIDLYPVYTPYVLGCLFFYINKSLLLIKNKNKHKKLMQYWELIINLKFLAKVNSYFIWIWRHGRIWTRPIKRLKRWTLWKIGPVNSIWYSPQAPGQAICIYINLDQQSSYPSSILILNNYLSPKPKFIKPIYEILQQSFHHIDILQKYMTKVGL